MLMPGRYVSDTTKRCMTITRSGWTTIMVDSCQPLIATATSLYTIGSATAVYNGSHLVFSADREVDGAGFVAQVAAGIDNSFEFNVSKLTSSSDEGVLVTVLETIDNVQYVIGGGRLQLGAKQRINFRSTGNNVSLLFTGPFNMVELAQVCTKYPKSVQHTYLVDVCDEDKDRYRFGFNGVEKDNELKGVGNSLDFGARMYDSRVARWLSLDPLAQKYPGISPYTFVADNPIWFIDPDGKKIVLGESKIVYVPGEPPPSSLSTVEAATWNNLNAIQKYDAKHLEAAVNSKKEIKIRTKEGSLESNTTPNGKIISFDPYMKADIKDRKGNKKGTMTSDRILDHELRHAVYRQGILKRPKLTEEDKNSDLNKNMRKDGGYSNEEYFNIKQDNEISEEINSKGGDEPIREDYRADKKSVKETMTKEDKSNNETTVD